MRTVPDAVLGERMCACVVVRPGTSLTLGDLTSFLLLQDIAKFKLPERLEIVTEFPLSNIGKVSKKTLSERLPAGQHGQGGAMRVVDLHCYPEHREWMRASSRYVDAIARYWNRSWVGKTEDEVRLEFTAAGVEAVLVALDLETTIGTAMLNEFVAAMRDRHPDRSHRGLRPPSTRSRVRSRFATRNRPSMNSACSDSISIRSWVTLPSTIGGSTLCSRTINALRVPVMIDVGTTGMGAGMPGGMGAKLRHAHPSALDELAADFPGLTIIAAHPGWPWVEEMTAVALHKGNVFWELSGWAPKHFPAQLEVDIRARLKDKVMFGSDYPSLPYARIFDEWKTLGLLGRRDGSHLFGQRLAGPSGPDGGKAVTDVPSR